MFEVVTKPTFTNQLLTLPNAQMPLVLQKIQTLYDDPSPHGNLKKKLIGYRSDVYRLRAGDYRVLYTYREGVVTLLGVDARKDVYKGDQLVAEHAAVPRSAIPDVAEWLAPQEEPTYGPLRAKARTDLPEAITVALLEQLRIPITLHRVLTSCKTLEDLEVAPVSDEVRDRVFDALVEPDFDRVLHQPDLHVGEPENLLRFKEGDLLSFLLRLSPEQEAFVTRALHAAGPVLIKGGPGTGKSTIALYRARAMIAQLRAEGIAQPRLLFTTYTRALTTSSQQLLASLLGRDDATCVEVRTADSLVHELVPFPDNGTPSMADQLALLERAIAATTFAGNALTRRAQEATIAALSREYLLAEILEVIEARPIATLEAYLHAARPGRQVRLNEVQRAAVWAVREQFIQALAEARQLTWEQMRTLAEARVQASQGPAPYDGVIVDEAQDLNPSALRLLFLLCREPGHFFVAADANQSIYGNGFRWTDVHAQLQFKGRTGILRANYRSTREIGEAAQSYLAAGELDAERDERTYLHNGPPPVMRAVTASEEEIVLLARFLREGTHAYRLGLGAGAALCPSNESGKAVAAALTKLGINARFMTGQTLDLTAPCVKVITLQAAKGLEFPIVAIAGYTFKPPSIHETEGGEEAQAARDEADALRRRTLFVGMTRAMRALLVLTPQGHPAPIFTGFDPTLWNIGERGS